MFDVAVVQISLVFQSQSSLQEAKVSDLTSRLEKLRRSYQLLFSQYPALNQYCPVSNHTAGGKRCAALELQSVGLVLTF